MKGKYLLILLLLFGWGTSVWGQVTSFMFDPNKVNTELARALDSVLSEDQQYRVRLSALAQENAPKASIDSVKRIIRAKDSANLAFVVRLIDRYGWLSPQDVGFQGALGLFLVIQHADLKTQKKYYPLILNAEKEGKILSSNVALLEDRIAIREGRPQTYGSQSYYDVSNKKVITYPLVDPQKIDSLRRQRGLESIKKYRKDWTLKEYNASLPYAQELLRKLKEENQ